MTPDEEIRVLTVIEEMIERLADLERSVKIVVVGYGALLFVLSIIAVGGR